MRKKILLVDDDPFHQEFGQDVLRANGYEVLLLNDCQDLDVFMDTVLTFLPDLILIEHHLKNVCGMDLVRRVRLHWVTANVPVVYYGSVEDIAGLAEEAGADAF
ncbi:MAG TPA: response regulator, partial [Puia sp.]|nr:response regulator [Puia sp.]